MRWYSSGRLALLRGCCLRPLRTASLSTWKKN
jgi:hypothetical protein